MASSTTKSVAARIPVESFYDLNRLAQFNNLSMSDYLGLVINNHLSVNKEQIQIVQELSKEGKEKNDLKPYIAKLLELKKKLDDPKTLEDVKKKFEDAKKAQRK